MRDNQISILLDLADVTVLGIDYSGASSHIRAESELDYTYCRKCGQRITALHEREDWVKIQHLPILVGRCSSITIPNGIAVQAATVDPRQRSG